MSNYTEADARPLTLWRHVKTDSLYVVLGVARCSTNGDREGVERSVVYWSLTHQHLCYREASEFLGDGDDGWPRFEPVAPVLRPSALEAEVRHLQGTLEALAACVAVQSELLTQKAEVRP